MVCIYGFNICKVCSVFKCSGFCNGLFCRLHAAELFSAHTSICNKGQSINYRSHCKLIALGGPCAAEVFWLSGDNSFRSLLAVLAL